ncbi:MAG TPA: WD40 repeat domain-containing serine/threonine-protein kinase, partial [Ktedonobacteraceae bacterium]|nr:WD40 repeat domain-containing serine/threonine-protein kinase [Ktedonobacteraceae bacterium]
ALSPLYCDACGTANRAQAIFCFACGQTLHAYGRVSAPPQANFLITNHLLKQRYQVLGQIGKGGFGAVYKAADVAFHNRLVAIKEMSHQSLTPQETVEATYAFKREAALLASLVHPNLPRIYEQFTDGGRWYLVMDFIEGETLEEYMLKIIGGKLSIDKVLSIGIQVCTVLEYLHNRQPPIVFRDLKPANIMLTPLGHIYLIDFGIARHFKPGQSRDTAALGSTGYAAPEQYGKAQTTPRADIYSLGVTLHELLTGLNPADNPFHFAPLNLPAHPAHKELEALVSRMLEIDINKRPANVMQVRQALENIATFKAMTPSVAAQLLPLGQRQQTSGYRLAHLQQQQRRGTTQAQPTLEPQPLNNTLFIGSRHTSRVTTVDWSVRGARIASASYDKTVRIWDARSGDNLLTYQGHWDRVLAVAWSADGNLLASAGNDGTIQIWDPQTGNLILTYREHAQPVLAIDWSPDGKRIVSACEGRTVRIWDTITGQTLYSHYAHGGRILTLGWSPDGKHIASAGEEKQVHVWSMQRERPSLFSWTSWLSHTRGQFTYRGHFGRINALAWSPNGQRVASVGADKTLQVWDATTGKKYFIHRNPSSTITCVAWSYDGRYLATGANDKLIQVWDTITRSSVTIYAGHTGYITSVSWSPDGKQLVSASVDHTVHVWHV